ncbi:ABC-2 type transport system permease protein [Geodermatophilus bullaregiensis]|uniref:ABC transporter permease n=1 Tax=Geodermatophilus bullaregiensis TaxID=1564160 RepID=UPI00195EDBCB|nr:ABC transporter permease [Geodermatophilus bullaregiensis]MBM7807493.1 ABC-2 type transport system permease protein [Geodermatophilus bullaregiensis]
MTAVLPPATRRPAPPSAAAIGAARTLMELRLFVRDPAQVVFSFAYPIVMLVIFASVFADEDRPGGVPFAQYFLAGIAATGIMLTSFQAVGTAIAEERDRGDLARLQTLGTPAVGYFLGKAGQVLVTTVLQLAVLLTVAATAYDVPLPADTGRWLTFTWVVLGGALAGTVLGIAVASVGSTRSVGNGIAAFAIVLQFFSGVFFVFSELPSWMQEVAAVFPLKWLVQGMRSVFLPDAAAAVEPAGSWEHGTTALVLAAWVIIGVVVCARTFRWRRTA